MIEQSKSVTLARLYRHADMKDFDPDSAWESFAETVTPHCEKISSAVPKYLPKPDPHIKGTPRPVETLFAASSVPQVASFQSRKQKGKIPLIETTLDLHGFTQKLAFERLCSFVHMCCTQKKRYVLVVTGKGNPLTGTGIIQQELPRWCAVSPLSQHIIACAFAPPNRGGKGAYILHLRIAKNHQSETESD
ncbi:MAG: Smr/MutS family protein [Alphaproteobacteria bacterium]|nr:MAG: Smr/MutS family protein [Alphaproteobacteria bacterium]